MSVDPRDAVLLMAARRIRELLQERKKLYEALELASKSLREAATILDEILDAPGPWNAATTKRQGAKLRRQARAAELRSQGINPTRIGERIGNEEKRRAFDRRTVERWLAAEKSDIST